MTTKRNLSLLLFFLSLSLLNSCISINKKTAEMPVRDFFTTKNGQVARLYSLRNESGFQVDVTNMGGSLVSIFTPDKKGNLIDILAGHAAPETYENNGPCFGMLVGRYANRITGAKFSLDGTEYKLVMNEKARGNTLHGGKSYGTRLWDATPLDAKTLKLTLLSPNGDAGFPGNLAVTVIYEVTNDNELKIYYQASTDAPTVINLTNHAYFNLNGGDATDCLDHEIWSVAKETTEVDGNLSATGKILSVDGTPFDLTKGRTFKSIYEDKRLPSFGIDNNFIVARQAGTLQKGVFKVISHRTGITLEEDTDQPGVQLYMGGWLGNENGKGGIKYRKFNAFCLEAQNWPDAPNHANFPNARLNPGENYTQTTIYRFGIEK